MLTEEQMRDVLKNTNHMVRNSMHGPFWPELEGACRAIESAATAPLLERIAELEHQLEEARKDAERYRWLVAQMMCPDADHQEEMFNRLHAINPEPANAAQVDEAIDAAMKGQP